MPKTFLRLSALGLLLAPTDACLVQQYCHVDSDCADGRICDLASGACIWECSSDDECPTIGASCVDHACAFTCDASPLDCGDGMVSVCGEFCMDAYEASRVDATDKSAGTKASMATSRPGVIPWWESTADDMNLDIATTACEAAGKRLCSIEEWQVACQGIAESRYAYGDTYAPAVCNGFDTFCDFESCGAKEPYAGCGIECGADYRASPTGSLAECRTPTGIYDLNGNAWELVSISATDADLHYLGGSFNASDPEGNTVCTSDVVSTDTFPSVRGFRCCSDGVAQ